MTGLAQKIPFVNSQNGFVDNKIEGAAQLIGKSWPCSIVSMDASQTIATVKIEVQQDPFTFPQITCPVACPQYMQLPLKAGDKGFLVSSDAYLGAMSGLGTGTANLGQQANLAACVFVPLGNKGFDASPDAEAVVIGGPNGVIAQVLGGVVKLVVNQDGIFFYTQAGVSVSITKDGLTLAFAGNQITLDANGINIDGLAGSGTTIDQKIFLPHTHDDVQTGGGTSGPVTP